MLESLLQNSLTNGHSEIMKLHLGEGVWKANVWNVLSYIQYIYTL